MKKLHVNGKKIAFEVENGVVYEMGQDVDGRKCRVAAYKIPEYFLRGNFTKCETGGNIYEWKE